MKRNYLLLLALAFIIMNQSCITIDTAFEGLPPGQWRAVLKLDDRPKVSNKKGEPLPELVGLKFEEVSQGELPFTFEVIHTNPKDFYIEIINGDERIRVDDIKIGLDRQTAKDTVIINFPLYESHIRAIFEERLMEGEWIVTNRGEPYSIPFEAHHGRNHRFSTLKKTPKIDLSGKWEVTFSPNDEPEKAIGDFKQDGNKVTGTFMTETGDYRFLEGEIQDNKLYLSVFDGAHAFLFEAKILEDETMIGSFRSGKHYKVLWEAKRNENFKLKNANDLTFLKEGYDKIEFEFENPDGKMISLNDEKYKGKIKIVQIFGTWCPNCRDETNYLLDYLKRKNPEGLEIIALAFEKNKKKERAMASIKRYKETLEAPYEMVWAGPSNKKEAAKSLPMLNHILSYPTMIFIDKNDKVRKIHTGFSGPATDEFPAFKKEFEEYVDALLNE